MLKWVRNWKATIKTDKYMVYGQVLVEDRYYGEYGMSETPCQKSMGEYELVVLSYDLDADGLRVASMHSETRLCKTFKDRNEANRVWAMLKNGMTFEAMRQIGFERWN